MTAFACGNDAATPRTAAGVAITLEVGDDEAGAVERTGEATGEDWSCAEYA
jgi:hypothetical protein